MHPAYPPYYYGPPGGQPPTAYPVFYAPYEHNPFVPQGSFPVQPFPHIAAPTPHNFGHQPAYFAPQPVVVPKVDPVILAPKPVDPVARLSDSVMALNLQDLERQEMHKAREMAQEQSKRDAILAKLLQETETQKADQLKKQEVSDQKLAIQLSVEEKGAEKKREEQEKKDMLRRDQELAKKLEEEERMKMLTLSAHEKMLAPKPLASPANRHALEVHKIWCPCKNTSTTHNNHLFKVHDRFCGCGVSYCRPKPSVTLNNQGKEHAHNHFCCLIDHIHNSSCFCSYEAHVHTISCCPYDHIHTKFCHCTHK